MNNNQTNPYIILKDVYQKKTHTSFTPVREPWTSERLVAMMQYVPPENLQFDKYNYSPVMSVNNHFNFYDIPRSIDYSKKTFVLHAHHDVSNTRDGCDNVVDNTGSVCILLALANKLRGRELPVNVVFAYTDTEELAQVNMAGSRRLAERILSGKLGYPENVESINLEVSCHGSIPFVDESKGIFYDDKRFKPVSTPFSDSAVMEYFGVFSSCIGIMTEDDVMEYDSTGSCDTWKACHTNRDKFELANEVDMNWFVSFLEDIIVHS